MIPGLVPVISGAKGPLFYTYNGNFSVSAASSVTLTNVNFGAAASDRIVVICTGTAGSGSARTLTSGAIGGVSAVLSTANGNNTTSHIIYALVPSGASGSVSLSWSGATPARNIRATSYSIYNWSSFTHDVQHIAAGGSESDRSTSGSTSAPAVVIACATCDESIGTFSSTVNTDYRYNSSPDGFATGSFQQALAGFYSTTIRTRALMSMAWV